jgi:hypothetical protein
MFPRCVSPVSGRAHQPIPGLYRVGGIPTPLKNMKVSWDDEIPNIYGKIKNALNHQHRKNIETYSRRIHH